MSDLTLFIDDLLKDAGFDNEAERKLLATDMEPVLIQHIVESLSTKLNESDNAKVDQMRKDGEAEEIFGFMEKKIPNFDETLFEIIEEFEENYLALMNLREGA